MNYGSVPVNVVCALLIIGAIVLAPLYGIWIAGGWIADQHPRR